MYIYIKKKYLSFKKSRDFAKEVQDVKWEATKKIDWALEGDTSHNKSLIESLLYI